MGNLAVLLDARAWELFEKVPSSKASLQDVQAQNALREDAQKYFRKVGKRFDSLKEAFSEKSLGMEELQSTGLFRLSKKDRKKIQSTAAKQAKLLHGEVSQNRKKLDAMEEQMRLEKAEHEKAQAKERKILEQTRQEQRKKEEKSAQEQDTTREKHEELARKMMDLARENIHIPRTQEEDILDDKRPDEDLRALVDDAELAPPPEPKLPFGRGRRPGPPLTAEQKEERERQKREKARRRAAERGPRTGASKGRSPPQRESKQKREYTAEELKAREERKAERKAQKRAERANETAEERAERKKAKKERKKLAVREEVAMDDINFDEFDEFEKDFDATAGAGNVDDEVKKGPSMDNLEDFLAAEGFGDLEDGGGPAKRGSKRQRGADDAGDAKRRKASGDGEEDDPFDALG